MTPNPSKEATALLVAMEHLDLCDEKSRGRFMRFLADRYGPTQAPVARPSGPIEVSSDVAQEIARRSGKPIQRQPAHTLSHPTGFQQAEKERDAHP